jgi:hypothetical protein
MRRANHRWSVRLLSATIALAVVCASSIGAYGHALAHCHYGHAHAAQPQDRAAAPDAGAVANKGQPHKSPAATHADCCDSICHGGYAIVGQARPVSPPPQAKPPIAMMRADAGAEPRSLDRPPKSPVFA